MSAMSRRKRAPDRVCANHLPLSSLGIAALDHPIGGDGAEVRRRGYLEAVHEPDRHRAGVGVAPEKIALGVAIEITGLGNRPIAPNRSHGLELRKLQAVEQPDRHRSGIAVAPENIGAAVTVKIP